MKRASRVMEGNRIDDGRTDNDLLQSFRNGEEHAFLVLYRRHQAAVFRFALHMSGNRENAEEVTQEVFLSLLAERCGYDSSRGSLEGFLIGVARNQVRRQERLSRPISSDSETATAANSDVLDHDIDRLRQAVLNLPARYREVVVLCEMEELSYTEAALRLECAVGTVRSRLHRARLLLSDRMWSQKKVPGEACKA